MMRAQSLGSEVVKCKELCIASILWLLGEWRAADRQKSEVKVVYNYKLNDSYCLWLFVLSGIHDHQIINCFRFYYFAYYLRSQFVCLVKHSGLSWRTMVLRII